MAFLNCKSKKELEKPITDLNWELACLFNLKLGSARANSFFPQKKSIHRWNRGCKVCLSSGWKTPPKNFLQPERCKEYPLFDSFAKGIPLLEMGLPEVSGSLAGRAQERGGGGMLSSVNHYRLHSADIGHKGTIGIAIGIIPWLNCWMLLLGWW